MAAPSANETIHTHRGGALTDLRELDEERSFMLTFLAFAVIVAFAALAVFGLAAEDGSGPLTSGADNIAQVITES